MKTISVLQIKRKFFSTETAFLVNSEKKANFRHETPILEISGSIKMETIDYCGIKSDRCCKTELYQENKFKVLQCKRLRCTKSSLISSEPEKQSDLNPNLETARFLKFLMQLIQIQCL